MAEHRDPKPGETWHTRALGLTGRRVKVCDLEWNPGNYTYVVVRSRGAAQARKTRIRLDRFVAQFVPEEA